MGWPDAIDAVLIFCKAGRVQAGHLLTHACLAVGVRAEYARLSELEAVPGGFWSPIAGKFPFAPSLFAVGEDKRENKG